MSECHWNEIRRISRIWEFISLLTGGWRRFVCVSSRVFEDYLSNDKQQMKNSIFFYIKKCARRRHCDVSMLTRAIRAAVAGGDDIALLVH
jgi:hypothetical protein